MQKANKIAAFFFLGLFSLMILHQAFPHLHHQHDDSHSHTNIVHSSEHHHHDDSSQEEKEEDSPYGLLGFVMDMHIHSTVASDLVLLERNTIEKQTIVDKDVAKSTVDIKGVFSIKYKQNRKPSVYHPPNKYFNSYLSSLDSRGPPSLG